MISELEYDCLCLFLQGKSNKQIALALDISPAYVSYLFSRIYRSASVQSRQELVLKVIYGFMPSASEAQVLVDQFCLTLL